MEQKFTTPAGWIAYYDPRQIKNIKNILFAASGEPKDDNTVKGDFLFNHLYIPHTDTNSVFVNIWTYC